ncbi:MAG: heme exporter protein CcmB [Lentimicrobium sp.]|nr:heme exporter protein CcmB [Lentimicrobium sp.]MDD2528647.1 heme exporter protein CcmB [Lentimicrobiaceae bacterium]MDD4596786.1 heme exporter protein CcmB [Lentimicrobiaceae bacterium]MDY0027121.1 heme exporter protein CcmB [Lentimicrobium sp.]
MREITALIHKDLMLELRQKYAINGILLYVFSTIFVVQLSFGRVIDDTTWIALFWIILLFAAFNAVSKSFVQESSARRLYYFTLASPVSVVVSKMIYNALLMIFLGGLSLGIYTLFMGMPALGMALFLPAFVLGCIGLATAITMVSAIASRTGNNAALTAILGFPVVLPLLLLLIKASQLSLSRSVADIQMLKLLLSITLIDAVVVILAIVLFPYLWRD